MDRIKFCIRSLHPEKAFALGALTVVAIVVCAWVAVHLRSWQCDQKYSHISPMARCASSRLSYTKAYEEFESELSQWVDDEERKGDIVDAAVYFRDLQNGPWFGIRESDRFLPASLFKVPVMMAVYKASEQHASLLQEVIATPSVLPVMSTNTDDPARTLRPNATYSIEELLRRMIAYSDNLSMDMLVRRLDALDGSQYVVRKMYNDLGVLTAEDAQTISVKSYATLFRILYNARYLNQNNSEKALSLLAESDFKDGLVAGVPPGVAVAHKFGVHNLEGNRLLHDCGIVYHPIRPYLICVMTRGDDIAKNVAFIAELSRRVYAQVEQNIVVTW